MHAHLRLLPDEAAGRGEFCRYCADNLLPLLRLIERLENDNTGYGLALSLSPTLLHQLASGQLADEFSDFLRARIRSAGERLAACAPGDRERLSAVLEAQRDDLYWYEKRYDRQLHRAFAHLASYGHLELFAACATSCALPLLRSQMGAVRAQIMTGLAHFASTFGQPARGLWLPGGCFFSGLENILDSAGVRWFCADESGLNNASAPARHGALRPVRPTPQTAAFFLNHALQAQLSSPASGYHLDPVYAGAHPLADRAARERADQHAGHYLSLLQGMAGDGAVATVALGADFVGTVWPLLPHFLDMLFRKAFFDQKVVRVMTPSAYLAQELDLQELVPGDSSPAGGNSFSWLYKCGADACLPELNQAAHNLARFEGERAVAAQMACELLLAQECGALGVAATGQTQEFQLAPEIAAEARRHLKRFCALETAQNGGECGTLLHALKADTAIFSGISPYLFHLA